MLGRPLTFEKIDKPDPLESLASENQVRVHYFEQLKHWNAFINIESSASQTGNIVTIDTTSIINHHARFKSTCQHMVRLLTLSKIRLVYITHVVGTYGTGSQFAVGICNELKQYPSTKNIKYLDLQNIENTPYTNHFDSKLGRPNVLLIDSVVYSGAALQKAHDILQQKNIIVQNIGCVSNISGEVRSSNLIKDCTAHIVSLHLDGNKPIVLSQ
jgi:adenine/guanine phosphoribosyltransferase-like PRPP-binding protein